MSVPREFTDRQVTEARDYVIQKLGTCRISQVTGKILGNPYVTYQELARHMGYEIEDQFDGDNMGHIAGLISEVEMERTGILLSAVIVRIEDNLPGKGFYKFAQTHGKLPLKDIDPEGSEEMHLWDNEVMESVRRYGK